MAADNTVTPGKTDAFGPLVIGVAGGSGSGKTTVVQRIMQSIGDEQVSVLEHDRYYRKRNDLRLEERASLNYELQATTLIRTYRRGVSLT